jgi:hypothetical protein
MYFRYLKRLYEKASAAWRREQRKNPRPCSFPGCGDDNAEIMPEGNWLCREHKAQWKALLPYKSHATRLTEMGIPFLSEADHKAGVNLPKKKKRRIPVVEIKGGNEYSYSAGRSKPATRKAPAKKK